MHKNKVVQTLCLGALMGCLVACLNHRSTGLYECAYEKNQKLNQVIHKISRLPHGKEWNDPAAHRSLADQIVLVLNNADSEVFDLCEASLEKVLASVQNWPEQTEVMLKFAENHPEFATFVLESNQLLSSREGLGFYTDDLAQASVKQYLAGGKYFYERSAMPEWFKARGREEHQKMLILSEVRMALDVQRRLPEFTKSHAASRGISDKHIERVQAQSEAMIPRLRQLYESVEDCPSDAKCIEASLSSFGPQTAGYPESLQRSVVGWTRLQKRWEMASDLVALMQLGDNEPRPSSTKAVVENQSVDIKKELSLLPCGQRCFVVPLSQRQKMLDRLVTQPDYRLVPRMNEDQVLGFAIHGIKKESLLRSMGLKDGDVLTSLGGVPLRGGGSDFVAIRAAFLNQKNYTVQVQRASEQITLLFKAQLNP